MRLDKYLKTARILYKTFNRNAQVAYAEFELVDEAGANSVVLSENIAEDTFRKFVLISPYASCGAYFDILISLPTKSFNLSKQGTSALYLSPYRWDLLNRMADRSLRV